MLGKNAGQKGTSEATHAVSCPDIERVVHLSDSDRAALVVLRKGNKEQVLPLTADARAALAAWLTARPAAPTTALFFRLPFQRRRARLHYASVEKIFKLYARAAGVPIPEGIAFHHLRHTAGQQMATVGLGIEEAQRLLGHANPATTQIYYEVTDARLRNAARRLRYRGRARAAVEGLTPGGGHSMNPRRAPASSTVVKLRHAALAAAIRRDLGFWDISATVAR